MIRIRISDPRSLGSWCIKETDESTLDKDPSVRLMHRDPSDIGSLILIWIIPKEHTLISVCKDVICWDIFQTRPQLQLVYNPLPDSMILFNILSPFGFLSSARSCYKPLCRSNSFPERSVKS